MFNFDDVIKENIKEHDPNWPRIPDHPYRVLIIGGSGSGKTNSLFNLINEEPNIEYNETICIHITQFYFFTIFWFYIIIPKKLIH